MENWRRPGPTPEQRRVDVFTGLAVTALALLNLTFASSAGAYIFGPPPSWPERVCWTIAITLPLMWRRRWPEGVALVVSVMFIAGQVRAVPESQLSSGALFAAIYTLGAWGRDHRRARRIQVGIIAAMFVYIGINIWQAVTGPNDQNFDGASGPLPPLLALIFTGVLINLLFFGFAWFFGETAWIAARRQHEVEVQAEQLRRSQAEAGERAVIGERVRIARELHDVVAHHVSVMGVQAAASRRVMDKDPAKARTALAAVEQSARTAVDELRRMLNVLRHTGSPDGPDSASSTGSADQVATAAIERVEDLLAGARDAGLTIEFGRFGEPVPVPESVSQAVYRIVQEAVTNTIKHAGATILDVRIRYLADALEVDVTDNGRGGQPADGAGLGLIGMRERVAAHDGTLVVGPRKVGGFRVRARFPLARTAVAVAP
jgi:signal transduction histidine kinase